jgi:hypothetical protein
MRVETHENEVYLPTIWQLTGDKPEFRTAAAPHVVRLIQPCSCAEMNIHNNAPRD